MYEDNFSKWEDVQSQYNMDEKEPDEVIVAHYVYEGYEGSSYVVYRNGENFYYNSGGHCSCYGLEGQWDPTEYSKELFLAWLKRLVEVESREYANGFESRKELIADWIAKLSA